MRGFVRNVVVVGLAMLAVLAPGTTSSLAQVMHEGNTLPREARVSAPAATSPAMNAAEAGPSGPYQVGATRRTFTRASSVTGEVRTLETVIWYPATASARDLPVDRLLKASVDAEPLREGAPFPVIVWSHCGDCKPWSSDYFVRYLASHGFVVVAPKHPDQVTDLCPEGCDTATPAEQPALGVALQEQSADITYFVDQMPAQIIPEDPQLAGMLDSTRVGVAGHAFGAMSALVAAAQDPKILATVAMAPSNWPDVVSSVSRIPTPLMLMGGARDHVAPLEQQQALFNEPNGANPERWLIAFPRGGNAAYTRGCPDDTPGCGLDDIPPEEGHDRVLRWATAFLLLHVAGDQALAGVLAAIANESDPEVQVSRSPAP